MFPNGVYCYPKPKSSKPSQNRPQPILTESHVAETSDASNDHLSEDDDEETPTDRPVTPHIFIIDPTTLNLTATSDVEPQPETTTQSESTPQTPPEPTQQSQPQLESEAQHSEPSPIHILHDSVIMGESLDQQSDHETVDNSLTITLTKQQLQNLSRNLDADHGEQPTSHNSELDSYINTHEQECIPPEFVQAIADNQSIILTNLLNTILSQPPNSTQNDIKHLLKAVNNNIRRLCSSLPDMSIEPSQISDECKYMKEDLNLMIDAVEKAYIKDFEDRKEAARLEAERLERERLENEQIEREKREQERLEQERIEKERQEGLRIEQARLEEEARITAEQAKLADFFKNAPEVALRMTKDVKHQKEEQEALKRAVEHQTEEQEALRRTVETNQQRNEDFFK
jgi:hypothetical protein